MDPDVPQDLVQAHKWFNLTSARGDKYAGACRDEAEKMMTPAQMAEAQQWPKRNGWRERGGQLIPSKQKTTVFEHYRMLMDFVQRNCSRPLIAPHKTLPVSSRLLYCASVYKWVDG